MTKRTEILHEITLWGAILSIIAILFSAFFFMDSRHASDKKVTKVEIELRQDILDTDINRNAKIKHHYQQKAMETELSQSDANRVRYIEEELDRQYAEQERLRELEDSLE
jgi:hypothetical protein